MEGSYVGSNGSGNLRNVVEPPRITTTRRVQLDYVVIRIVKHVSGEVARNPAI